MPQVRDPKTGRYTSGGGSSVGGAAGTNPRIQKAKAVGNGATAGGTTTSKAPTFNGTRSELKKAIAETESGIKLFENLAKKTKMSMYSEQAKSMRKTLAELYAADSSGGYKK
jgi:hypothetical protein